MGRVADLKEAISVDKWQSFLDYTNAIDAKRLTNPDYLAELERLQKVLGFMVQVIPSLELHADILPLDLAKKLRQFPTTDIQLDRPQEASRNLIKLNDSMDEIIVQVMPFVSQGEAARAAGQAMRNYRETIEEKTETIADLVRDAQAALEQISSSQSQILEFRKELLGDETDADSIKSKVDAAFKAIEKSERDIQTFHGRLFTGDPANSEGPIATEIDTALQDSNSARDEINEILSAVKSKTSELRAFYKQVFGQENDQGEFEGGLKHEVEKRQADLIEFEKSQNEKISELVKQIESLLPGATSAGLASAYSKLNTDADKRERRSSYMFYSGLLVLFVSALVTVTDAVIWNPFSWTLIQGLDFNDYLNRIIPKLPIVIPVLWFTLTASKRRSEMHRLKEEYAHKEALAKTYIGFKKQIDSLQRENDPLVSDLLAAVLNAIQINSAQTLNGKHGDKLPIQEIAEAVGKVVARNKA